MSADYYTRIDMMGREVKLPKNPQRVISLVPSQTELLFDLGLGDRVVGITKFCVHPKEWFKSKEKIGGTKTPKFELIRKLNPDLIIGNKEENDQESIELLEQEFPVWISDIYDLDDALAMINEIGGIVREEDKAHAMVHQIQNSFPEIEQSINCLYFIWRNPWMLAGKNVFINSMLDKAGFNNILMDHPLMRVHEQNGRNTRYPSITDQELRLLNPDVVLLSSEPFPFKEKHIEELEQIFPDAQVELIDGEVFSWYGSRLLQCGSYFKNLMAKVSN